MQNANRQLRKLAVLNELVQMGERLFLAVANELDHVEDGLDDGAPEVIAAFVAHDAKEEAQHGDKFGGEFEAEGANGAA